MFVAVVDGARSVGGSVVEWTTLPIRRPVRSVAMAVRPGRTEAALPGTPTQLQEVAEGHRREAAYWKARAVTAEEELQRIHGTVVGKGVRPVPADVASSGGSGSRPVLRLGSGSGSGIAAGQAVADRSFLVGRIAEDIGAGYADVELITAAGRRIKAELRPPPSDAGEDESDVTRQWLTWNGSSGAFEEVVPRSDAVEVGDIARLDDPLWPAGSQALVIGAVVEVVREPGNPELYDLIRVRPLVDLSRLQRVTVLVPMEE